MQCNSKRDVFAVKTLAVLLSIVVVLALIPFSAIGSDARTLDKEGAGVRLPEDESSPEKTESEESVDMSEEDSLQPVATENDKMVEYEATSAASAASAALAVADAINMATSELMAAEALVTVSPFAANATKVGTWAELWTAWNNSSVDAIEVTQSIVRTSTGSSTSSGNSLPALTRDLKLFATKAAVTIDFGSETNSANAFTLGARSATQPTTFEVSNLTLVHTGTYHVVNSSATQTNTAGWNIVLANVSSPGTPSSPLVNVSGAAVFLSGAVTWNAAGNNTQINASALVVAGGAKASLSKSAGGNALISLVRSIETGENARLTLSGGDPAVNITQNTLATASFGVGSALSISNATTGLLLPVSPTNTSGNGSIITFEDNSSAEIAVSTTAIRGTGVEFKANSVARISASSSSASASTLINLRSNESNIDYYFKASNNARVSLTAVGGNCLDVGGGSSARSAKVQVTSGAEVIAHGSGSGGGDSNAVIVTYAASGGYTVTDGGILEAYSDHESSGYPAMIEQITGGTFKVSGIGSRLTLAQKNPDSSLTAVLRFRSVGNQTFDVSYGAEVNIRRPAYTSSSHAAAIRFGDGANNSFNIHHGGHVYLYNGGAGSADTSSSASGGNDAVEFNAEGFSFYLSGADSTGPSSCEIVADKGAAIDANSNGKGVINVGAGAVFVATGNTGDGSYPIFYANGAGCSFTMHNPLYYDFTNKRAGGGALATIASGGTWASTYSDVAVWVRGSDIAGNPTQSYSLTDYKLTSAGVSNSSPCAWNWTSGDTNFQSWYAQNNNNRLQNYTRISANNAMPAIDSTIPATNADKYVRWLGTVAEGLSMVKRAFWDDEVSALVHVVKANGAEFDTTVKASKSINAENPYQAETNAANLSGVLRLEKASSEPNNLDLFLEQGDSYQVVSYWRGDSDPSSPKRLIASDYTNAGPITVLDIVPPLPATSITPANFYENQRELSGTWVQATHDNPPVSLTAQIKRGSADFIALPGTGTLDVNGTWTFTIPDDYLLQSGDVIAILFCDANGNTEPTSEKAVRDMIIPAAATITVQKIQYDIEGTNKIIGLSEAQSTTSPEQLAALNETKAYRLAPTKEEISVEVKTTNYPYGSAVKAGDYYVTYKTTGIDFAKTFSIHVDANPFVAVGTDYYLSYAPIAQRKNYIWADSVSDAQLLNEANAKAYKIEGWSSGALHVSNATAECAVRNFTKDSIADDYFTARVAEAPSVLADVAVNLQEDGILAGIAFNDSNSNGILDSGEAVISGLAVSLKVWDGAAYVEYRARSGDRATTDVLGAYQFFVPAGKYRIEVPDHLGNAGITTYGAGYFPLTGVVEDLEVAAGDATQQEHRLNVGYNTPAPAVLQDITNSFAKTVNDGTGNYVATRAATNANEVLEYKISFAIPAAPAELAHAFAGFYSLSLQDTLDSGLVFAPVGAPDWNVSMRVGNAVVYQGVASGATSNFTFDSALITQYLSSASAGSEVSLLVKAQMQQVGGSWPDALINRGRLIVNEANPADKEVQTSLDARGSSPQISFSAHPLVIKQSPLSSHLLSVDELKAALEVTDAEDYPLWSESDGKAQRLYANLQVAVFDDALLPLSIDTKNIGVYKVRYIATDSSGNTTTAYRAVVIDDGRYELIDEDNDGNTDFIIGARNFVIQQSAVQRLESHLKQISYAEAFDAQGQALPVELDGGIPQAYSTASAPVGNYPFVWKVVGHKALKAITGYVVVADAIDPGTKDSQYAIYASNFLVNTVQAQAILDNNTFITNAQAHVVKLVAQAPDKSVLISDIGSPQFAAVQGSYQITFALEGISAALQKAVISAVVSNGQVPALQVATPINIWIGTPKDKPIGALEPAEYSQLCRVVAIDPDGAGKNPAQPLDISAAVVAQAQGAAVDTTNPGTYLMHFEVTDADNNTVSAERLVVVNDGRYSVGAGRVLFAKPFVVKKDVVAINLAEQFNQVRGLAEVKLIAGSNESEHIRAGDVLSSDQIGFLSLGGYTNAPAIYPISIQGLEYPLSQPPITHSVSAEVIDAGELVSGSNGDTKDNYYLFGNNITLTPVQADNIQNAVPEVQQQALLTALGAGARKAAPNGTLYSLGTIILDDGGFFTRQAGAQETGSYQVTLADADAALALTLNVIVVAGDAPKIVAAPQPLVIPASKSAGTISEAQLLQGVSATDTEDDAANIPLKVTVAGSMPSIAANVASVTKVTYSVTDSAGNTSVVSRAVVIDDGAFIYNQYYILRANSFVVKSSEVVAIERDSQVKLLSNASAWAATGDALAASRIRIANLDGYRPEVDEYTVTLELMDDTRVTCAITAKVYDDSLVGKNGERYAILARDFTINVTDANALSARSKLQIEADFLARADASSYKRSGDLAHQEGSKALVAAVNRANGRNFADCVGTFAEGDRFNVSFWVSEDHTAVVQVALLISNGNEPELTVPAVKVVPVGEPFLEGTFGDANPSYLQGVSVYDYEDDPALSITDVAYDRPVDTLKDQAIYTVSYSVVDSDYNSVTKRGVVLVGDWIISDGYGISARDFSKKLSEVTGTEAEIKMASSAKGVDLREELSPGIANFGFGKEVGVIVSNDDGYYQKAPSTDLPNGFAVTVAVEGSQDTSKVISVRVDDDRLAVIYSSNSGLGNPPATTLHPAGSSVAVAAQGNLTRTGYSFAGWALSPQGSAAYQPGEVFAVYQDTQLYAVWTALPIVPPTLQTTPPPMPQAQMPMVVVRSPAVVQLPGGATEVRVPYDVPAPVKPANLPEPVAESSTPLLAPVTVNSWSLASVLLAIVTFILASVLAFCALLRRDREYLAAEGRANLERRREGLQVLSCIIALLGLVPFIVLLMLDDISAPMKLLNENTLFVACAAIFEFVLMAMRLFLGYEWQKKVTAKASATML